MSKSLQRGILFSICVALVLALSLTLVFFAGGGDKNILSAPQGQVSGVADAAANAYEHGGNIGRTVSSNARTVTDESTFLDALANNHDINLKANLELTSSQSFLKKDNNGNISADPATSGTALVYSGTIYGNGYNITITGSQDISNNSAVWDCGPNGYGDAANVYGGLVGKLTGQIYDLNVTMKSGTMEKIKGNDGGDRWLDVGVIAGIVDDVNARIENCSVTIPANTQITALKSPISNVGWGQSSAGTQYVRAAGIAAELNNGTIVNCTVTNNGCISAGLQENKDDNSITNGYYGAAANAVAWVNNGTLNNIIVKGSGKLIGLKTAAISVVNNSNISPPPTTNAYNGYTGTYEFRHGDDGGNWSTASMYVSGARQAIANFYQASNATTRGGANKDQTSHELANSGTTLTVNPSTYTIYFDPTKSSDDTRLAVLFNNENYSAGAEYELYGASRQISNAQISGANGKVLARNLPATPSTWNSGNNFTASVQIAFDPSSYAALTKYDHGYVDPDNRTTNGTPIGTGEDFEAVFSPSGTISGTDYYLTNDIVITGFTGKEFSGTLDGNGHTIFITGANTCAAQHIGGIVGTLTGTIKNVRVVLVNSVTANTSVSNANVGLVAGHINGGSLINVSVDIPADVTLKHTDSGNDSSLGGIAGSAVSGATFTNVTMNFNGTLSNIKTSGASGGYWPFTSAFVGKPSVSQGTNSPANSATFNNIIIRGNGTFASQSSADDEPPYYAAIGIIQHKGVTNSTAAVYNVNGLIYDFNPQFADNQGATSGNHGACYGLFVNNNNNNAAQVQYYGRLVNYGSGGVYNASGEEIEAHAFNGNGNAPVPNPANIKNITETVTNVTGSAVKAYFMPGDSASTDLTLVASASNWNGVTQLQLDGAAPAVTSADDGSNKVVNVAKSTAVNISGENLTLSPYNPYTVITASLDNSTKVYDGNPFVAQVSFTVGGSPVSLTDGQYTITYTDGNATGETNANASGGTYSLTVTLKGTASDGTQYVFDAQGTKTKTFTYTITPLEVTGTWSVRGLEITYGDAAPDYDQYISIELTNEGTIPGGLTATDITGSGFTGGLTATDITGSGFTTNYTQGTAAGTTVNVTAGTFVIEGSFTASNYDLSGITGSGTVEVQKKRLTISDPVDSMGHITDNYGENVTTFEALADLFEAEGMSYVQGLYGSDAVTFAVTTLTYDKWYDDGAEGAWESDVDASSMISGRLYGNTAYNVGVKLASDNSVNNNYDLQSGSFVYAILPLPITVTGVELEGFDGDYIYDGSAHDIKVNYTGALDGDELEFTIDVMLNSEAFDGTALTDAGTYSVSVSFDPQNAFHGEANYNYNDINEDGSSNDPYEVTIKPFDLTNAVISITSEQFTYDGTEKTVEYTVLTGEGGKDITSVLTPAGNTQTNAGDAYTLTLTGGDNFTNQATATWSIGRAKLSVTAPTAITFMDKAASELSDYLTTGNWITGFFGSDGYALGAWTNDPEYSAVTIGDVAYAAAGTYTAAVRLTGENADTNYELSASTLSVTVNPYDLSNAEMTVGSLTYNGEEQTADVTVTANGADVTALLTVSGNTATAAGSDYTAKAEAKDGNFSGSIEKAFTVAKKQLKLDSITLSSPTYTGAPITVADHTFADGFGPADGEQPELSIVEETGATVQDAGTYTFDVTLKEASTYPVNANYVIAADGAKITATVSPATVTVTAGKEAKLGALYGVSATAETSRFYESDFITFDPAKPDGTFTLADALTFTVTNDETQEDVQAAEGAYTLAPGTYTVTYTISNIDGANYTLTAGDTLTTTLTVKEGALKLTITGWNNTSPTYNGMAQLPTPVFADSAEIGEKIEEGALVYEVTAKEGSSLTGSNAINAGSYTVAVSIAAGFEEKYELVGGELSTDFTIEQLEVVLKWEAEDDLVYNGKEHTATATVSNKVDDDVVEVTVGLVIGNNNVNVGEFFYEATELTGDDAGNYSLPAEKRQAFEVTPAQKEITWNFVEHATIVYGDSVEDVKKLVNIAALNGTIPGVADPLTFTVSVGNYSATTNAGTEVTFTVSYTLPEGAKTENYNINITAADGNKLTVGKATLTLAIAESASLTKVYDGEAVTPSVTVMFGERELESSEYGAVTYTYAIKDGDTLDAAPADASDNAYTVTANVAESTNFNAATSAAVEFNIARKILTAGNWSGVDGLTYNGKAAAPKFEPEGVLEGDSVTATVTVTGEVTDGQAINAGKYTATAKLEGDDAGNYEFDGVVNVEEFTIARKALTVLGATAEFDFGVIGETTNTYKEQIASWDDAKNKVITGFFGNDTYTLGDIKTADTIQEVVYTDGKLNAGSYYVVYTVGDNYTIGSGVQVGHILLTVKKLSYEISLTYTIDNVVQSGWDGNISFNHDAPITLTFNDNALEITFNDGSEHKYVVTVDGTLPNATFTLGGITINESNSEEMISSVQSMKVVAQITPEDETNHEFMGTTSFNFTVKRNTRVEANEEYFSGLGIPSEYTGSSISVETISASATEAFTVTLGGVVQSGAEVSIAAKLNGKQTDSICDAGDYVITATYTTETKEVVTGTYEFTVAQAKLSFTLESAPSIVYGEMSADVMPEALKAFTATGVNGKSVTGAFAITVGLNENIYSNAGFVKAGSYDFTITFTPDDANYAELVYNSADNNVKLTVEKKTITPFAISYGEVTSEGTTLTLPYAGKEAYEGNLEITPNGKFEDDDVEFMDEGDYSNANEEGYTPQIRIYESGDGGNYTLDLSGWKVVVLKKTIEVKVTPYSDTYTGSAIKLTAASEEVVKGDVVTFTVSGDNVVEQTVTNAGTYALTVTLGGEQGNNYAIAGEPSVTIGKARVDIVWTNEDELKAAVYNGQPYEATADVMFNGQSVGSASIKYTSDEVTVTDEAVNAGRYTATATFAGTDNFHAASEDYDFTIAKMVLYGKWNVASDMDLTYDGTSKAGYATWSWTTAPLNEGDVTVGYKYELNGAIVDDVIDAGNYNVYAVFTDNTGNYDTESGILQGDRFDELTVARRAVTVKWSESVSFTYNGAEQAPTATALNVAQGDSLTLTVTGAKKDVGTYTATVEAVSVTGNYVLAEDATVEFTIAPKPIGVEWTDTEFTYNGTAHKPTATATGLVGGDSLTLTVTGAQTNAGSYTATVAAFEQGNYKLESTSTTDFTIAKADLTVTPASLEIRERETEAMQAFAEGEDLEEAFAGRISVSGVSGTVRYTVTIAGDNNYDDDGLLTVGAHTFTIDAGDNYNAASVSVMVIATPVVTVIASVEGELVYNGSAFEISYALKEGAPEDVSMDDITVTATVETIVNAGEYEVTFTVTGSNEDYDYVVQDASGNAALTFTIARRGLDVAEVAEAVYGNLQVSGTLVTGTHTAFVAYNDEEIELIVNVKAAALSRAAAEYLDAGEYEVTIALANEDGNFSLNGATLNAETQKMEVESTLDVAPKTVTVGYTTSSKDYDAKGISITLEKFEDMLIEGDDPAVNIYINDALYTGRVVLDAGDYTVRYESADPNYAFTPVSATFTVEQKHVTPNFDLNTGSGSLQITGGGKLEIEEGEETDIVAAIDNFMQSSGVPEEDMSISVSGDLKLEDMATWAPGTYTVKVTLSGNHSGSIEFTVEVSEKVELPPPVQPELPETPAEAGSGSDWVLPLVIAIVALIDLALLVAIGVAAKKRA